MNRILSICLGLAVVLLCGACVAFAGNMDAAVIQDAEATTSASVDTVETLSGVRGLIEGVFIIVTNQTELYVTDWVTSDPSINGVYFNVLSTTYNSSNQYLSEDEAYKIRYETSTGWTNWALSSVATALDGPVWTNDVFATTNWQVYGTGATGMLQIAATTTDVDIDLVTADGFGYGTERTIFSADNITSDAYYPIRLPTVDTGGSGFGTATNDLAKIPTAGQGVRLSAYAATESNVTVKAIIYLRK